MYRFLIKNYMKNGSFQASEAEVYSVPIEDEADAFVDPSIRNEMGKAGSFEFSVNPGHPLYDCWMQMRTILRVEYDGDTIFRGRVITVDNTPLTGERKIHAEGDLAFLLDSQQEGIKDDDRVETSVYNYLLQVIGEHNYQMESDTDKKIFLGLVPGASGYSSLPSDQRVIVDEDMRKYGSSSWQNTMSALEQLQKTFGGVFRTRYQNGTVYLDWLENYFNPVVNAQAIEVSENMISVSNSSEVENIFTYLIPVGSIEGENLYLPEKKLSVADIVNGYASGTLDNGYHTTQDYLNALNTYGPIVKVEQFRNADTEEKLRRYAYDFIRHNFLGGVHSFTVTALDLHHIDWGVQKILIGDRVPIEYPTGQLLSDCRSSVIRSIFTATSITYRPHDPEQNEYIIGIPESQMSKEYGVTKSKKDSISSSSGYNSNSLSSGISSVVDKFDIPDEFPDVIQEVKSYDDLAWTVVRNNEPTPGCWYDQSRYNSLLSQYPLASSKYQVERIAHDLIKNHMSTGDFGTISYGPFTITGKKLSANGSWTYNIDLIVTPGITPTQEMRDVMPGIRDMLRLICSGYLAYINAHPDFLNQDVPSALLEVLGGNGLTVFSSALGDLRLPSGWDISGDGDYNISGAASIFTNVLGKMGISVSGGILSKDGMKQFLDKAGYLSQFLDSVTGIFNPKKLLDRLPESIRKEITDGELTKKASDWLMTKFPILKNLLGTGETQLTMSRISDFINNIPLIAPDEIATASAVSGQVTGSSVSVNGGTTVVNQNGIQMSSGLAALLNENGHVTRESFLKVFPRLSSQFVSGQTDTLSTSASNYVVKKFPELGDCLDNNHRLTLSAIETKINAMIQSGQLKNTQNATAKIDANTGKIGATGVELGADAEANPTVKIEGDDGSMKLGNGSTDKVELNGWDGIQYVGKDANGDWLIMMNEPITYVDGNGVTQTVPAGTVGAKDFYLQDIPSFHTQFAVIDQAIMGRATIGQLQAAEARITSLETNTVKTNELYVQGTGQFAGFIKATAGIDARTGYIHTKYLYTNNDSYVYGNAYFNNGVQLLNVDDDDYDQIIGATARFGNVTKRIAGTGDFRIGLKATENNDGTISIAFINDPNGDNVTANFKIAATQKYINDVAAIKQAVQTALNASGAGSWSDGTKSLYIGLYIDSVNKKVKVGTAEAKIQYPGENVTTLSLALPSEALDLTSFYNSAYNAVTISTGDIVRSKSDVYNSNTHNTFIYVKATASNGNESGEKYFQVSGSDAYEAGKDDVSIVRGGWSAGIMYFTKSSGASDDKKVDIRYGTPTWNGAYATIPVYDRGTGSDVSINYNATLDVSDKLTTLFASGNGTYTPESGYIGYSQVEVSVSDDTPPRYFANGNFTRITSLRVPVGESRTINICYNDSDNLVISEDTMEVYAFDPDGGGGGGGGGGETTHDIQCSSNVSSIGTDRGNRTNAGSISKQSLQAYSYLGFTISCGGETKSFYITINP